MAPDYYEGYTCPNPKCKKVYLWGLRKGIVRMKCLECGHDIEFIGERKPHSVDLGIKIAPNRNLKEARCAECGRWLCSHSGTEWLKVKCSKCRNHNIILGDGTVQSIGRETA